MSEAKTAAVICVLLTNVVALPSGRLSTIENPVSPLGGTVEVSISKILANGGASRIRRSSKRATVSGRPSISRNSDQLRKVRTSSGGSCGSGDTTQRDELLAKIRENGKT